MIRLLATFNTDDDAGLHFEGNAYCFYGPDLVVDRVLPSAIDCYKLLRSIEIVEHKGGIAEMIHEFIETAISKHYLDPSNDWSTWYGNQELEIQFIDA